MTDLIKWLKNYWWLLVVCGTTISTVVIANDKIDRAYSMGEENKARIEAVNKASEQRTQELFIQQAKIDTDLANIKASLLRIESKLDRTARID